MPNPSETRYETHRLYQGGIGRVADSGRTQIDQAMTRIAALLREDRPRNAKEALDRSTYMLAERARLMALTLRLRAAHVKVEAAQGLTEAANHLEQSTFWRYSDEG